METEIVQIVFFVMSLLLVSLVAEPLARMVRLPFAAVLVILGFLGSYLAAMSGYDVESQTGQFHDLVFFVFLPVLIFESAFTIVTYKCNGRPLSSDSYLLVQGSRALALFSSMFVTCRLRISSLFLYLRDVINRQRQGNYVPQLPQITAMVIA